jgi:D-alanine transaminase
MKTLGYYNGEYDEIENMRIPMDDRVCWFGDGIYDATLAINHKILFLEEHIDRFFANAPLVGMTPPLQKAELAAILIGLVHKVESPYQFVYFQLTRGTAARTHAFPENKKTNLWIFLRPSQKADLSQKIKLVSQEDTRFFHCNIKTLNLLPNVLASQKAKEAGAEEAVFYRKTADDIDACRVTECSHGNIGILTNGTFRTAQLDNLVLPGITRAHILKQCGKLGIPVIEKAFTFAELFTADEIIVSSSSTFCREASHIDGKPVGGKASGLSAKIKDALLDEAEKYIKEK